MKAAIDLIATADRGQLKTDLQNGLDEIVNAIEINGGGTGEVKITLTIKRKGDAYQIGSKLDVKVPQKPRLDSIRFFDADSGELVGRDPRQPDLPVVREADFQNKKQGADAS